LLKGLSEKGGPAQWDINSCFHNDYWDFDENSVNNLKKFGKIHEIGIDGNSVILYIHYHVNLQGETMFTYTQKAIWRISRYLQRLIIPDGIHYVGRPQIDMFNLATKEQNVANGLPFEDPQMVAENTVIGRFFINNVKTVVNIGCGVGTFENNIAPHRPDVTFVSSDYDSASIDYCKKNRYFQNVTYCTDSINTLCQKYSKFDLAVTVDVIEHLSNYKKFLEEFFNLSDRAVIATPNRDRWISITLVDTSPYKYHVQEFDAGELYFILKMYYRKVQIYAQKSPLSDKLIPIGVCSQRTPLIAYCER